MIAKERRDARWKLLIGALVLLTIVTVFPRPYEMGVADTERQTRELERELQRPVRLAPPETPADVERFKEQMREDVEKMKQPGYPVKAAGWELQEVQRLGNYAVLVPLAGLLGVALVSGEVGQGSVYLLLSKPVSRRRMLLTKYSVGAAGLFAVALVGAAGVVLSAYARGYPSEAVPALRVFGAAALMWLGSLFVLGVALVASVVFRNVISTILATIATVYLVHAGPDLVRSVIEGIFWTNSDYMRPFREINAWQNAFEAWRLSTYWGGFSPHAINGTTTQSFLVCLLTAAPPLLLALWLFRRKAL